MGLLTSPSFVYGTQTPHNTAQGQEWETRGLQTSCGRSGGDGQVPGWAEQRRPASSPPGRGTARAEARTSDLARFRRTGPTAVPPEAASSRPRGAQAWRSPRSSQGPHKPPPGRVGHERTWAPPPSTARETSLFGATDNSPHPFQELHINNVV